MKGFWRKRYFLMILLTLILFCPAPLMQAADQVTECPHYENGDYWVFNTQEFSADYRSKALNGNGFKVIFQDGQFNVEDFPYQETVLRYFFPCAAGGPAEQLKLPLYLGSNWNSKYVRSARGKTLRVNFKGEVVNTERLETGGEIFQVFEIHRSASYEDDPTMGSDDYYFYAPEMRSIVLFYRFSRKSFFASRIYLTMVGSKAAKSMKSFDATKLFDPVRDKQFFELYSPKH